jgi:hypothetical protein
MSSFFTIVIPNRFIGEESAFASKPSDSSGDAAAPRNDNLIEHSCCITLLSLHVEPH